MPIIDPDLDNKSQIIDPDMEAHPQEMRGNYWHHPITRGLADVAAGMTAGGIGIHNAPYNLVNMVSPQAAQSLPAFLHPENAVLSQDQASGVWGVNDPNIADKLIQGAAQYAPYGIAGGKSVLGQTLSGAAAGATQSDDPLMGAAEGAVGAATIGAAFSGAKTLLNLRSGMKSLREALSPENISAIKSTGKDMYNQVMDRVGEESLFDSSGKIIPDSVVNKPDFAKGKVGEVWDKFQSNPTIENAHWLRKNLNDKIIKLELKEVKEGTLTGENEDALYYYQLTKKALNNHILNRLNKLDPNLADQYKIADVNWASNVMPHIKSAITLRDLEASRATPAEIEKQFYKIQAKAKDVEGNTYKEHIPVPETLKGALNNIQKGLQAKKIAIKAGILGGTGLGITYAPHLVRSIFGGL